MACAAGVRRGRWGWVGVALLAGQAGAFTFETVATTGCHEQITLKALGGSMDLAGPTPAPQPEDTNLEANLPFTAPPRADVRLLALLVGVRHNDLHGAAITDFPELVATHLGDEFQDEHCLRSAEDDGELGNLTALAACRAYIHSELEQALGTSEVVDPDARESLKVALRYQATQVPLPRMAVRLGRALHALQDAFSHSFRSDDFQTVHSVLNYIDPARAWDYSASRDGHGHMSALDGCTGSPEQEARAAAATEATRQLLMALTTPDASRTERLVAADAVLDRWLSYSPGCTALNDWCSAPELGNERPAAGCSATAGTPMLAALLAFGMRCRGRKRE